MIPVYHNGRYLRHVSPSLTAAEVAGRCLRPWGDTWRRAERRADGWHVRYHVPTAEEIEAWENRPRNRETRATLHPNYAHG